MNALLGDRTAEGNRRRCERWRRKNGIQPRGRRSVQDRAMDLVVVCPSGCWLWAGAKDKAGYGLVETSGHARPERRTLLAHKALWEAEHGPVPAGYELDHTCRVRHCVNPGHLEPVTHAVNVARGRAGRPQAERTHCPSGHEYTPENIQKYGGRRHCRACNIERLRRRRGK